MLKDAEVKTLGIMLFSYFAEVTSKNFLFIIIPFIIELSLNVICKSFRGSRIVFCPSEELNNK